jgi:serine/threonine protein kinase
MKSLVHPYIIRLYEVGWNKKKNKNKKNVFFCLCVGNGIKESHLFSYGICCQWWTSRFIKNWIFFYWWFHFLDLLLHEKRLSEAKAKEKFRQLVLAVEYIHSKNIVNTSNILFFAEKIFSFRFIVCWFQTYLAFYDFNLGDLKAENLLLDDHGNIKVAGMRSSCSYLKCSFQLTWRNACSRSLRTSIFFFFEDKRTLTNVWCMYYHSYFILDFGFANTFKPNTKLQTFCGSPP